MRTSGTSTRPRTPSTDGATTFRVLGPLEVRDGTNLLDVHGPQERALLALLLTAPGRVFSVRAIVTGMWGDDPPGGAEKTVQSYVSRLRRSLPGKGAALVLTRSPGYVAAVDPAHVDAERFRALAATGRQDLGRGHPTAAAATLREALALWRGEAYAEFDAPFASAERAALEEMRLAAVEDRVAADLGTGSGQELVAELEALVSLHPWRERLWGQLMTALYRSGRQGDALRAFQRARTSLVDDLGVEPGPDLQAVEAMVLSQDARLLRAVGGSYEGLPRALTFVGPTFVGRDAELARLLDAYGRVDEAAAVRVLVTGPHGMGKTRVLAELAQAVQERGGLVVDRVPGSRDERPRTGVPVLVVLDDLQLMSVEDLGVLSESVMSAPAPLFLVGACVWSALTTDQAAAMGRTFHDRLPLPPLEGGDISEVVALYVPPEAVADAVAAVDAARGVPLQLHALASRYGEDLASERVSAAAAGIPGPRRHLTASRDQVTDDVVDLQRIRLLRAAHMPDASPGAVCPYKGLAFFDVDDAAYFFGRERLVAGLVARLVGARFLAVVGASGSGKSSVVRAGLVAAVRSGVLPGSERWRCVLTTPTEPLPDLTVGPTGTGTRTLLVVDQFEELFTALPRAQQDEYAEALTNMSGDDVSVVVAVRSDYYGHATVHRRLADLLAANHVLVGEMTADELRQAVERPAVAAGLELEPGLAETLAGDVAGEPGGLPLMSTALLALWEHRDGRRLSLAAYREQGGVRTAVARLAETAYEQLTATQQSVARRTLLRLAETGEGGEPVRRRVPIDEVAPDGDNDARAVLDTLAARRLLTVSETHAEVAHEALLREWPRLRGWLDEDEVGRRLRRHLAPAALAWMASGDPGELYRGSRLAGALDWQGNHPDDLTDVEHDFLRASRDTEGAEAVRRRRSIRRLRGLAAGLAAVLALAVVASLVAVDQRQDAARSSLSADVRALRAAALEEARWDRALLYAVQAQRFEPSDDSRSALLETVHRGPQATAVLHADQGLPTLALSGDGTRLAASGLAGSVYVWDATTRERTHTLHGVVLPPAFP
ncbi:MAG TPA: BTAD domain-containing putative transcriptional regulator, partial [Actinomycetales bacterium]|nr:BTAD domain-containing putative transcriptional regulator [Actinomycetales bacterium]